jgi:hypothetical protein
METKARQGRPPLSGEHVRLKADVPVPLRDALAEVARRNQRSLAGEIRLALFRHLNTSEGPTGGPSLRDNSGVEPAGNVPSG